MRDYEFRAWDEVKKEFHYFDLDTIYMHGCEDCAYTQGYSDWKLEKMPKSQKTGLKDKNEVDVWEGDIVGDDFGNRAIVVWSQDHGGFAFNYKNKLVYTFYSVIGNEVIGNIYENPEFLLKTEETENHEL